MYTARFVNESELRDRFQAIEQAKFRMQKNCTQKSVIIDQICQKIKNAPQLMDQTELEFHLTTLYVAVSYAYLPINVRIICMSMSMF